MVTIPAILRFADDELQQPRNVTISFDRQVMWNILGLPSFRLDRAFSDFYWRIERVPEFLDQAISQCPFGDPQLYWRNIPFSKERARSSIEIDSTSTPQPSHQSNPNPSIQIASNYSSEPARPHFQTMPIQSTSFPLTPNNPSHQATLSPSIQAGRACNTIIVIDILFN